MDLRILSYCASRLSILIFESVGCCDFYGLFRGLPSGSTSGLSSSGFCLKLSGSAVASSLMNCTGQCLLCCSTPVEFYVIQRDTLSLARERGWKDPQVPVLCVLAVEARPFI